MTQLPHCVPMCPLEAAVLSQMVCQIKPEVIPMSVSPVFSHGKMSSIKGFLGLTWKMQEVSYVGQANG